MNMRMPLLAENMSRFNVQEKNLYHYAYLICKNVKERRAITLSSGLTYLKRV